MPFVATWMDLEIIIMSEVSQTEQEKYHMISHMCYLKRNDTNEKQKETQRTNMVARGMGQLASLQWTDIHCFI